jgi:hypothetical protein
MNQELLIRVGGVLQLGILTASALVPGVLDWRRQLRPLDPLLRHLIWVHGAFIVLVIAGFGLLAVVLAGPLADGSPLARGVSGLIGVFWLARLAIQFFLFDATPYLTRPLLRLGLPRLNDRVRLFGDRFRLGGDYGTSALENFDPPCEPTEPSGV